MNTKTLAAWIAAAAFALVAIIVTVGQPLHWKRTLAVSVVLALASAAYALQQSRARVA